MAKNSVSRLAIAAGMKVITTVIHRTTKNSMGAAIIAIGPSPSQSQKALSGTKRLINAKAQGKAAEPVAMPAK